MGKLILIAMAALTLSACGKVEEDPNAKFGNQFKPTTNTSSCTGTAPTGLSVFSKTWRSDWASDTGVEIHDVMTVQYNSVTVDRTCVYGAAKAAITVRANAAVTSDLIQILSNAEQTVTIKVGDKEESCFHSLQSGKIINYTFKGMCLQTTSGGNVELMPPAN